MSELRSTHKRWREEMQHNIKWRLPQWQAAYPKSYKRYFSCYIYRNQGLVDNPKHVWGTNHMWGTEPEWIPGPRMWRVEVGIDTSNHYADFPLNRKDRAQAFAVELLLKGLAFKIIYRKPR